ncbi:unnamed protein product [Aureobasidium uvarum]|uniref:Uncharacterized protein n=1 Tax=Aureobasidium uvarum TaxID=2773716 RepID=A0A9N8KEJ2_9PEZI|nr:unnamed protein product [Aureobasidium uvarum]
MDTQTRETIAQGRDQATHRSIISTIQQHLGQDATHSDRYNLCNNLVQQQKYTEAEPTLKDLLVWLAKRPVLDANSGHLQTHFLDQEAGTMVLLLQSLRGQGRDEEADGLWKGVQFSSREKQSRSRELLYGLSE